MSKVHAMSERVVDASPDTVYSVLADYKDKRPQILTENFLDYRVEKGGKGKGTQVSYRLQAAGRERSYRMNVEESVKGQWLMERDSNSSLVTTWLLSPVDDGQRTKVRVETEWEGSQGVGGFFERTFAPLGLHRIYDRMLDLLEIVVTGQSRALVAQKQMAPSRLGRPLLFAGATVALVLGIRYLRKR